jgi:hypothetical protein
MRALRSLSILRQALSGVINDLELKIAAFGEVWDGARKVYSRTLGRPLA